ncbi:dentin sialophosphoprotein-like isoform X2 [Hyla sarda]|uniref:dentin sialophosphoprotein-like isoform X2 n=1 Tax=Hyla sarda TaxID=327740 RepID=UPI0024C43237|nr:dentin sialophosphoprotein-like isoform X2 [Hyla sarda]
MRKKRKDNREDVTQIPVSRMKTFLFYGYLLGLTLASPITISQERKEGLRRIDNHENNGDHHENSANKQMQPYRTEIPKMNPTMHRSLNDNIIGMQAKKDDSGVRKQTSNIEIRRSPKIKIQHRRDLSHLPQKLPKKKTGGKKPRPNKIIHSNQNVYNTSRKIPKNDMLKHKLVKGSIMKQLQKRSIDYEDTPSDPYQSPDISYDWDSQESFKENDESQDQNESVGWTKNAEDFSSNITDTTDSSESDPISSNESGNPTGSPESSNPSGPNEADSSNESSYNTESEDSFSDVINNAIVLEEESDPLESAEPNVQNSAFTTPVTESNNEHSKSRSSSDSVSQDTSSQSNEPDESSKSSDSVSNESSNSSDSNVPSHSTESITHLEYSAENMEDTGVIEENDVIEENEIHR